MAAEPQQQPQPQQLQRPVGYLLSYAPNTGFMLATPSTGTPNGPSSSSSGGRKRKSAAKWTKHEDDKVRGLALELKAHNKEIDWKLVAAYVPGRDDNECMQRFRNMLDPNLRKGPWTAEEDEKIIELVKKHGAKQWTTIAEALDGRTGKQCRER